MRRYVVLGATAVASYSAFVEFNRRIWLSDVEANKQRNADIFLNPNSTEAIISDNLGTGDLILFRRAWHKYHIPTALYIWYQQSILETEFDHAGVIVVDNKGEPYVFESSRSITGINYKLHKFSDRICHSKAKLIYVKPLHPRLNSASVSKTINATTLSVSQGSSPTSALVGSLPSSAEFRAPMICWNLLGFVPSLHLPHDGKEGRVDMKRMLTDEFHFQMAADSPVRYEYPVKQQTRGDVRFGEDLVIRIS